MRITNKMMTNNMLHNINTNKNNMSNLENKYASGMEIQKPSDDPIVAVRALKQLKSPLITKRVKNAVMKTVSDLPNIRVKTGSFRNAVQRATV